MIGVLRGLPLTRPRIVLLAGSSVLGFGLVLASRASTVEEFQFLYGVVVGAGGGAIFAPLMATVAGWFDRHRSLAVSLVSAGMGVAPMTVAPIAARLNHKLGTQCLRGNRCPRGFAEGDSGMILQRREQPQESVA